MSSYVLSAAAESDLNEIWDYIAQDNVDAADEWVDRLFDAFRSIARTPGMGHRREDLTALPIRFWPVGAYLVLYRAQKQGIEIVAVTRGSRDIPSFLSRRS